MEQEKLKLDIMRNFLSFLARTVTRPGPPSWMFKIKKDNACLKDRVLAKLVLWESPGSEISGTGPGQRWDFPAAGRRTVPNVMALPCLSTLVSTEP